MTEGPMQNKELDEAFVAEQRRRLEEMRDELSGIRRDYEETERERAQETQDYQGDHADEAQSTFEREVDGTIEESMGRRLEDVERALQKMDEGTYGISDESGDPIPKGRLQAAPEAVRTVNEQQEFERTRRPPTA